MDIKNAINKNPLSAITVAIAVIGVVFSVFNFYLLSNISPLERRVGALETWKEEIRPEIKLIPVIDEKIDTLKDDVKDIKSVLKVR